MRKIKKLLLPVLCLCLFFEQAVFAQGTGFLDISRAAAFNASASPDKIHPLHLRSVSYNADLNNFRFLVDKGDLKDPSRNALEPQARDLLNYFFIGLILPNESFWVNLRPDGEDRVIASDLARTDVGRIFLEADVQLKKDTARFTSPETPEGRQYWEKLCRKAEELLGRDNSSVPTLTRPWIVPGEIIIRESGDNAYIYKATLKVMVEADYLADGSPNSPPSGVYGRPQEAADPRVRELNEYSTRLIRELIVPKLTREVNTAARYASLRQVYYSLTLAQWFKAKFAGKPGYPAGLIDSGRLAGLTSKMPWRQSAYYEAYEKSFKDGEFIVTRSLNGRFGQRLQSCYSGGITLNAILNKGGDISEIRSAADGGDLPHTKYVASFEAAIVPESGGGSRIESSLALVPGFAGVVRVDQKKADLLHAEVDKIRSASVPGAVTGEDFRRERITFTMIKPDGISSGLEIIEDLRRAGFEIILAKMTRLERGVANKFYAAHRARDSFKVMIDFMTSGEVAAFIIKGDDGAYKRLREMLGKWDGKEEGTLRNKYGVQFFNAGSLLVANKIHGSDSFPECLRESNLVFTPAELKRAFSEEARALFAERLCYNFGQNNFEAEIGGFTKGLVSEYNLPLDDLLRKLDIVREGETIVSYKETADWERKGDETYIAVAEATVKNSEGEITRRPFVAKAIVTMSPGTAESWMKRRDILAQAGVRVPYLYSYSNGTMYLQDIPHESEYVINTSSGEKREAFIRKLASIAAVLDARGFAALDFIRDLRSDGEDFYYCDVGSDLGDPGRTPHVYSRERLLRSFARPPENKLAAGWYDEYRNEIETKRGQAEAENKDGGVRKTGGIDFRALPVMAGIPQGPVVDEAEMGRLEEVDIDLARRDIFKLLDAGMTPSADKIREYVLASCVKRRLDGEKDRILDCFAAVFRQEEDRVEAADASLKNLLMLIESGKAEVRLHHGFNRINFPG